jgi:ABC-2 type transport system permease protein
LRKGASAPAQVIVDGTNSNTALIALSYVGKIVSNYADGTRQDLSRRMHAGQRPSPTVTLEPRPGSTSTITVAGSSFPASSRR